MARTPLVSSVVVLGLALLGLRCAFLPGPSAAAPARGIAAPLQGAALASSALVAAAAPVLAEEIDGADAYSRKVFTGAAYAFVLAAFLVGLIISQARKLVENKWLN
mmetsp:Transcript_17173/g.35864  ORF Transcript_17173/g.35864 Transcript_17173/m.35864 type:complete len:106 (-) Transcript_17173:162-479(-)